MKNKALSYLIAVCAFIFPLQQGLCDEWDPNAILQDMGFADNATYHESVPWEALNHPNRGDVYYPNHFDPRLVDFYKNNPANMDHVTILEHLNPTTGKYDQYITDGTHRHLSGEVGGNGPPADVYRGKPDAHNIGLGHEKIKACDMKPIKITEPFTGFPDGFDPDTPMPELTRPSMPRPGWGRGLFARGGGWGGAAMSAVGAGYGISQGEPVAGALAGAAVGFGVGAALGPYGLPVAGYLLAGQGASNYLDIQTAHALAQSQFDSEHNIPSWGFAPQLPSYSVMPNGQIVETPNDYRAFPNNEAARRAMENGDFPPDPHPASREGIMNWKNEQQRRMQDQERQDYLDEHCIK